VKILSFILLTNFTQICQNPKWEVWCYFVDGQVHLW